MNEVQEVSNNPKLNPNNPKYNQQPNNLQEVNPSNPTYNPNDPKQNLNNPNYNPNDPSHYPNQDRPGVGSQSEYKNPAYVQQPQANKPEFISKPNPNKPYIAPIMVDPTKPTPPKSEPAKVVAVKGARDLSKPNYDTRYPFNDLAVGDGYFVANQDVGENSLDYLRKETFRARDYYSIAEHDENGDEIWETLIIKNRSITNGKFNLDDYGNYIMSATQVTRPKLLHSRHFSAITVMRDADMGNGQKAPADGVLVIREA
jgi:hypothetical protein